MQISLEEVQKVARAYRAQKAGAIPVEPVPAPYVACDEDDKRLAREIARALVAAPDVREERVQEVRSRLEQARARVPANIVAGSIIRRVLADNLSQ